MALCAIRSAYAWSLTIANIGIQKTQKCRSDKSESRTWYTSVYVTVLARLISAHPKDQPPAYSIWKLECLLEFKDVGVFIVIPDAAVNRRYRPCPGEANASQDDDKHDYPTVSPIEVPTQRCPSNTFSYGDPSSSWLKFLARTLHIGRVTGSCIFLRFRSGLFRG